MKKKKKKKSEKEVERIQNWSLDVIQESEKDGAKEFVMQKSLGLVEWWHWRKKNDKFHCYFSILLLVVVVSIASSDTFRLNLKTRLELILVENVCVSSEHLCKSACCQQFTEAYLPYNNFSRMPMKNSVSNVVNASLINVTLDIYALAIIGSWNKW